jgi:hypothetical protein
VKCLTNSLETFINEPLQIVGGIPYASVEKIDIIMQHFMDANAAAWG